MIDLITIQNFAHIDFLQIQLSGGLNIITGETGAGKSVILDALQFVAGSRIQSGMAKNKEAKVIVTVCLCDIKPEVLIKYQIQSEDVILKRVIDENAKSRLFLNDHPITAGLAKQFMKDILDISAQHDNIWLNDQSYQARLFDIFAKVDFSRVRALYHEMKKSLDDLTLLQEKSLRLDVELAYLNSKEQDIANLQYQPQEELDLLEKRQLCMQSDKVESAITYAHEQLNSVVYPVLARIEKELEKATPSFQPAVNSMSQAWALLQEAEAQIMQKRPNHELSIEDIDNRIHMIRAVTRKYNISSEAIGDVLVALRNEIESLNKIQDTLSALEKRYNSAKESYINAAQELSIQRHAGVKQFEDNIIVQLSQLYMDKAKFKVNIEKSEYGPHGFDGIEFLVQTNPDTSFGALSQIASGGELCRIFLAIKSMANDRTSLVFDEIDSAFSGKVAFAVGKHLKALSVNAQVIAITHQPQVACFNANHIKLIKHLGANTIVEAVVLNQEEKVLEIARMLAGDVIKDTAITAAKELIHDALAFDPEESIN